MTTSQTEAPHIELRHRSLVCENSVFFVYLDRITDKFGREVPNYLSVVPKYATEEFLTGVAILPIKADQFGLLRVFRHPLGRWSWEIPKGFMDSGELPTQAALRELKEEMGLSAAPESLRDLGTVAPDAGVIRGRVRLFAALAVDCGDCAAQGEIGHGGTEFFALNIVLRMITTGEIEDACTVIAVLKYVYAPHGIINPP